MRKFVRFASGLLLLALIPLSIYGIIHRRAIYDAVMLHGYEPPSEVVQLADKTTMNDGMRRVFYVNHPKIDGKDTFRNECKATEESIVLGCYVESQGIFLLDVNDQRLAGVMEVTAAHETLHAEYDRLSDKERKEIDTQLQAFFATLQDRRIHETIENYRKKDPSVVPNELHSIIGTEVRDLPPALESYYARYFKDRKVVVGYSEQYEQVFTSLKADQDKYIVRLDQIKSDFDTKLAELNRLEGKRSSFKSELDALRGQDRINEYNARVDEYNQLVNQRNALVPVLKSLSAESEDIVNKYNNSIVVYQGLIDSIDANSVPKAL